MTGRQHFWSLVALGACLAWPLSAVETGTIEGTAERPDGIPLSGVVVTLDELGRPARTDEHGAFEFGSVAPGTYTLIFTLGTETASMPDVVVKAGATTTLTQVVDWALNFAQTLTVYSASRRTERIVDAPAAITMLTEDELALEAAPGQLPKALEFTPGVEIVQNGLYDFNLNTRGLNSPLTRRVLVIVDGRDPSIPFLASQEWALLGYLAGDLARAELVRGPGSALYGANSFNGVLNLVTRAPSASLGGQVQLTAGELDTVKVNLRWAAELGGGWYAKLLGEHNDSGDFARDRTEQVEYQGLDLEVVPLPVPGYESDIGQVRFDRQIADGRLLSLEAGLADGRGTTLLTSTGRATVTDSERGWGRINFNTPRWNFLGYYNDRQSTQLLLNAGFSTFLDDYNYLGELQGNRELAGGRLRLIGGLSYGEEKIDTADPNGVQTLVDAPVRSDQQSIFGQVDYDVSDRLKLVLAGRWDAGSLHDGELSPRTSLVYGPRPRHTFRLSYNEAFQVANYAQLFLQAPAGAPLDLSVFEAVFAPLLGDVSLGLDFVPVLSFGNPDQRVEQIRGVELGYRAILGDRAFLTLDLYRNRIDDILGDLTPGVNPSFPAYRAPTQLPSEVATLVETTLNGTVPGLSNDAQGNPIFVLSFNNSGVVDSQGLELTFTYDLDRTWLFSFTYSWLDFEVKEAQLGGFIPLPNAPEHKLSAGVSYHRDRLSAALRYRWADDFDWTSGLFVGPVPSYDVVNLSAAYDVSDRWRLGANVSNLLDEDHYEVFGGDVLERRALGYVAYSW